MIDPRHVEAGVLTVHSTDAMSALRQMPDESVQCVVTSPPYWSLRDYRIDPIIWDETVECEHEWGGLLPPKPGRGNKQGDYSTSSLTNPDRQDTVARAQDAGSFCSICGAWRGCLGLEPTPELYVQHIVQVFREIRRVLRKDGTCWLNLGDSYATGAGKIGDCPGGGKQGERWKEHHMPQTPDKKNPNAKIPTLQPNRMPLEGLKPKDLIGIPWRCAFALQSDGWWLRSDIVWSKPNPMPESVTDRPTRSHEYLFLLTKSRVYYYDADAIREPLTESSIARISQDSFDNQNGGPKDYRNTGINRHRSARQGLENLKEAHGRGQGRNCRSVWTIPTAPFPEAHFATFPKDLVIPCVLAGSKAGDVVMDPFGGSGTTPMIAIELGRKAIVIEPNPEYVKMIEKRTTTTMGLPL